MKLFKVELRFKNRTRKRFGADVVVHARSKKAALDHLARKFTGSKVERTIELKGTPKHFVIADLLDD